MAREQGPFRTDNPWPRIGWRIAAALIVVSFVLGFVVVSRPQQGGPTFGIWAAICRGLGITSDTRAALELSPPVRTPSRVAWTPETLRLITQGDADRGAFVAGNCTACHGERGISRSALYPTLAGMEATTIFKQLDDFRAGKRSSGVMSAIATALTAQSSADVAAYFASQRDGLPVPPGQSLQSGHSFREDDVAVRLVFAGDPSRGIPPCTSCHGPSAIKLGAPRLTSQHAAYIERQLGAFKEGLRRNDINEQMRTIAFQLTATEMHAVAELYGVATTTRMAER